MALQTFTAGQVLTAAQVNALQANDYNQTVSTKTDSYTLVAADKGTRIEMNKATATTITVNTNLFNAGDTLFIQNRGAGVCTITAGTATVSTAGSLALVENAGGTLYFISAGVAVFYASGVAAATGALTLISSTTVGSAVASVTVSSAFSATYDNYKIIMSGVTASVGGTSWKMVFNNSSGSFYYYAGQAQEYTGGISARAGNGVAAIEIALTGTSKTNNMTVEVLTPFLAQETGFICAYGNKNYSGLTRGYNITTTSQTGFTFSVDSGTITGGTIKVYGYQN